VGADLYLDSTQLCFSNFQLVPVSVTYDVSFEELTGSTHFSLWNLLRAWLGLGRSGGFARVDFDQPMSVKELMKNSNADVEANGSFIYRHLRFRKYFE